MNKGIGVLIINISVALYLFATGILGFSNKGGKIGSAISGNEIRQAVNAIFKGDVANVVSIIFAILAIIAGVLILLKLFSIAIPSMELILIIIGIFWLVFIILIDIVAPLNRKGDGDFLLWLRVICPHLMVLGSIILSTDHFGGK